jgi:uncharacterized protein (TIGR03663 family)
MTRWGLAGVVLVAGIALALRLPRLSERPMHNDEAVNGVKFGGLWEHNDYKYDPAEYHGPTLPYATLAFNALTRAGNYQSIGETRLRLVTLLFGLGLVLVATMFMDGLGKHGVVWAGLFTAVSTAMVFYSRYYIHEMLLVFFTALTIGSGWRYWRTRKPRWAVLCGAAVGLMWATKETFALAVLAVVIALGLNQLWNRKLDASGMQKNAPPLRMAHVGAGLFSCIIVASLLFSSFFTNAQGLLNAEKAFWLYLTSTRGQSPHVHSWSYYFECLGLTPGKLMAIPLCLVRKSHGPVWSEGFVLALASVGAAAAFLRRGLGDARASFVRFLALYSVVLAAIYSLISYKTPWCLLSFWHGFILLAGVGAVALVRAARFQWARLAMTVLLVAGATQLAAQAWQASSDYEADLRNPYVYSPTSPDVLELVGTLDRIASVAPEKHNLPIQVMAANGEYWPLPWYFRNFNHVGWYGSVPEAPFAPVIIASPELRPPFETSKTHQSVQIFGLRPNVFLEMYVQPELWQTYLKNQKVN